MPTKYNVYFIDCANGTTRAYKMLDGVGSTGKRLCIPVKQARKDIEEGKAEEVKPWWI